MSATDAQAVPTCAPGRHPLETLTAEEIEVAVAAVRATGRIGDGALFSTVTVAEPAKDQLAAFEAGSAVARRVHLTIVPGPACDLIEAVVDVEAGEVVAWDEVTDARPAMLFEGAFIAMAALAEHDGWRDAMAARGITDLSKQIDPWPTGSFGVPPRRAARVARCIPYYREEPTDNGYARPVEGVLPASTWPPARCSRSPTWASCRWPGAGQLLPGGQRPLRTTSARSRSPSPRAPASPSRATSCAGSGGRCASPGPARGPRAAPGGLRGRWDGSGAAGPAPRLDQRDGRALRRPRPLHGWKNAFDAGEWGLGRMANSRSPSAATASARSATSTPSWPTSRATRHRRQRHLHARGGLRDPLEARRPLTAAAEVRRSRRMVISRPSPRSATTSTASTGTCTSTATSSSR
jgi:primary-amine oxidase